MGEFQNKWGTQVRKQFEQQDKDKSGQLDFAEFVDFSRGLWLEFAGMKAHGLSFPPNEKGRQAIMKGECTKVLCQNSPLTQEIYQCLTCSIHKERGVCWSCAMTCHKDHKIFYVGVLPDWKCHCSEKKCLLLEGPPKPAPPKVIEQKGTEVAPQTKQKHIMLSYNWGAQPLVLRIYDVLKSEGFNVWMDIKGGMKNNINASMAEGVEGAYLVLVFMTQKYQESANCSRELQYATSRRVPFIPIKAQPYPWEQSGWLGLLMSGELWVEVINEDDIQAKKEELMYRLRLVPPS